MTRSKAKPSVTSSLTEADIEGLSPDSQWAIRRSCISKTPMEPKAAKRKARNIDAERGSGSRRVRSYRCPFCGNHHVGSTPASDTVEKIAAAMREMEDR